MRWKLVAVVAAVAVVVGVVVAVTLGAGEDRARRSARPHPPLTEKDAAYAVEGGDFEVVHEIDPKDGADTIALLPDGRLVEVVYDGPPGFGGDFVVELVDPATGEREALPAPWTADGREVYPVVTVADGDRLWAAWSYDDDGRRQRTMTIDLATGEAEQYDEPSVPLRGGARIISHLYPDAHGRLWFQTGKQGCGDGECAAPDDPRLWSFDPRRSAPPRVEAEPVTFDVHGELLVWTDGSDLSKVHLRDLATDKERTRSLGDRCRIRQVVTSGTIVAASCGDRQVLMDADGRLLATLRLGWDIASLGDRWATFGSFAYDTETGRLLRLYDAGAWADDGTVTRGDLVVTPIGVSDPRAVDETSRFASWAVVRLSDRDDVVGEVGARAPAPFICWNGKPARAIDNCYYPSGRKGMAWAFPDSTADNCRDDDLDSARQRFALVCRRTEIAPGTTVDLRFVGWGPARGMERYYEDELLHALPVPGRHTLGFEIRSDRGAAGVVRYNGLFTNDLSVEIRADDRPDLFAAIDALEMRPWSSYRGRLR